MAIVDIAVYSRGARVSTPAGLEGAVVATKKRGTAGRFAWVGLLRPTHGEIESVAQAFGLHPLAVEDALKGQQRSKAERYGDDLAIVVRAARYIDDTESVEFGEVHAFLGEKAIVTVRQSAEPDLAPVRKRLEAQPELLALGPFAVLYAILDEVVDAYAPVVAGLENDIDEIEDQIFSEDPSPDVSRRIYELHREVILFQRAVQPLSGVLDELRARAAEQDMNIELRRLFRDVHDHVLRVHERIEGFRSLLDNALMAHAAIVGQRQAEASLAQSEQTKRISAWAAILFAPALVGTIYGMNFDHMPELSWQWGYPFALGLMAVSGLILWTVFRKARWL